MRCYGDFNIALEPVMLCRVEFADQELIRETIGKDFTQQFPKVF